METAADRGTGAGAGCRPPAPWVPGLPGTHGAQARPARTAPLDTGTNIGPSSSASETGDWSTQGEETWINGQLQASGALEPGPHGRIGPSVRAPVKGGCTAWTGRG
jgi:hypothetical protein